MEGSDCVYGGYHWAGTPQFGQEKKSGCGDHFIVEDLLDFSNEEEDGSRSNGGDDGVFDAATGNSTGSSAVTAVERSNSSFSGSDQHISGDRSVVDASLSRDLCEPHDELAELEWLSNFVEDSFSSKDLQKLQLISSVKSGPGSVSGSNCSSSDTRDSEVPASAGKLTAQQPVPFFLPEATAVPGKARSKRSRAAPCNWSSRLLVLSPTSATSSSYPDSIFMNPNPVKKTPKPAKKKEPGTGGSALMAASDGRKCLHCATDKTPQWRTGPMGPKTLCNACGVRYKSGRLVPEYRPAASPTFVLSKHSNSHRKVLELRRQKEMQQQNQQHFVNQGHAVYNEGAACPAGDFLIHHLLEPDFRQLN